MAAASAGTLLMLGALVALAAPAADPQQDPGSGLESATPGVGPGEEARGPIPDGVRGDDPPPAGAVWDYRPESVHEMAERAETIVVAAVVRVKRGPFIHPHGTRDRTGEGALPTQRIDVRVQRSLGEGRGAAPSSTITLFRTGGARETGLALELEGDPEYEPGERYVLFLRKRAARDGTLLPVAPDGRLQVNADDRMTSLLEGSVSDEIDGRTVAELEALIDG